MENQRLKSSLPAFEKHWSVDIVGYKLVLAGAGHHGISEVNRVLLRQSYFSINITMSYLYHAVPVISLPHIFVWPLSSSIWRAATC